MAETAFFNQFDGTLHHAGPRPGPTVPDQHKSYVGLYDVDQILTEAQRNAIEQHKVMAFHCFGDSGTDDRHNGNDTTRQAVADMIEAERAAKAGQPDAPCFCYHLGDVIYPGGDEDRYEGEFYVPYAHYRNAIVAVPGNHDYYGDHLASYRENFMQPTLDHKAHVRPAMNLPGYHWVLESPVAAVIGLAATSNYISSHQRHWFEARMEKAPSDKALIVAVHYPPYCFDGSDNSAIRQCIEAGIGHSGRMPDLVVAGHSHNYQRILSPSYPVLVIGTGGVGTSPVNPYSGGNGSTLLTHTDKAYGAATLVVDAKARTINVTYNVAAVTGPDAPRLGQFDQHCYGWQT